MHSCPSNNCLSVHFHSVLQPAELEALLTRALKSALQSESFRNGVVIDGLGCSYADTATTGASLMSGFGLEKKRECLPPSSLIMAR